MSFKSLISLMLLLPLLTLSGCGEKGLELVVGSHENEESIVFSESKILNKDDIEEFREIIENSPSFEYKTDKLPDHVIVINNTSESTMELMVNLWVLENNTLVFTRGINGGYFYKIDGENYKTVKNLINID